MLIDLYQFTEDPRAANKSPALIAGGVNCKPVNPFSLLSPRLIINYSALYDSANYIYIQEYDTYYFAEKILLSGVELQLSCKLDPYNTYDLSDVPAMVIRSESAGVNYVPDNKLPVDPSRCYLVGKLFPQQPFADGATLRADDYLLTINGGTIIWE